MTTITQTADRIDVHVHFIPDFYRDALAAAGYSKLDGIQALPSWDATSALQAMQELGVRVAILSVSSPGVHFGDNLQAQILCRRINEYGAELKLQHPGRFGHLASVSLPDVEGAKGEASHALDKLGADGVIVLSNHHGLYLGDEKLESFWAALNERSAVVLIHPTAPAAVNSRRIDEKIPLPAMEYFFDTSRSIVDMVTAGVPLRYPNIRFIVPHAGSVLPILTARIDIALPLLTAKRAEPLPTLREAMRSFHFDLAGAPVPELLSGLLTLADERHLHYGSDYPFTPIPACKKLLVALEHTPLLNETLRSRMFGKNATQLFPQFAVC